MRHISTTTIARLALCFGLALIPTIEGDPAAAAEKNDPFEAAAKNPRSGAALNLEAAKRAIAAGTLTSSASGRAEPRRVLGSTVNATPDPTASDTQSTTTLIDLGGGNLFVAFNDSGSAAVGSHFTGFAWSDDGGLTWTDAGTLPASAGGDAGNPVAAYNKATHTLYLATLGFTASNLQVFKSTDLGHTFGAPVNGTGLTPDTEWIAVDNFAGTGQNNVYMCYAEFGTSPAQIRFTRSIDGGATFSPAITVDNGSGTQVQGCHLSISPDHQINLAYFRSSGGVNSIQMRRSTDQGLSFSLPTQVSALNTTTVNGSLNLNGGFRSTSFPHCAVNPVASRPWIYCVFNDDPSLADSTDNADIFLATSTDGGATWTPRVPVNDDTKGDQFYPSIASRGGRFMISYYSRSHDPANLMFHRRAVVGVTSGAGVATLNPSFQLSPDASVVRGQDPSINTTYMVDYDEVAAGVGSFSTTWSDNRLGNAFHTFQPDIRFASIASPPAGGDLTMIMTASPPTVGAGDSTQIQIAVTASGSNMSDVFVSIPPVPDVVFASPAATGGQCWLINGLLSCNLGKVSVGTPKTITIDATPVSAGDKKIKAMATTSNQETNPGNNARSTTVSVTTGSSATHTYSTGNIAAPIPDEGMTEIPISVPQAGSVLKVEAKVRLNHTFDGDLKLELVAPSSQTIVLSNRRGAGGANYGSATNDCVGTPTTFRDSAATSITAGAAPFAGQFKPEQPLQGLFGEAVTGTWKLRVSDLLAQDTGTVGCVKLVITRH